MRSTLPLAALLLAAAPASAGTIEGKLAVSGAAEADRTVVYVAQVPEATFKAPAKPPKVSQKGARFSPAVLPVVKGFAVDLTNDDWITHSVFSKSAAKPFDLGLYPKGETKLVTFDKLGAVELFCSIHPRMNAVVLVLQNPHFTKPDDTGAFKLEGVPAGKHELRVYRPGAPERTLAVTVPEKGAVQASF